MKFPLICAHKKHPNSKAHKRMLLTEPNSLVGYRIGRGDIKLVSVLGVGGNGVVYHAIEIPDDTSTSQPSGSSSSQADTSPPRAYAVKAISKVGLDAAQLQALSNEFALHKRVSGHANILAFHDTIEEPDFFFLILDYVPDGDIFDMIQARGLYAGNDELIKKVFVQLLDAVAYCHRLGVAHRDIKPENILCREKGEEVLLADFGLATDKMMVKEHGFGSEPYMAPQCFRGFWKKLGSYSTAHADIWSLGVVLVNLACTRNPWHKATEESPIFRAYLNDPDHLMRILPISPELNRILRGTFALTPHARLSLADLRTSVLEVKCFTRDVTAPRPHLSLTPGAAHTVVAKQITNLTLEDIQRLESEARSEDEAALVEATASSADTDSEDEDAVEERPPSISPTSTLVAPYSTAHTAAFAPEPAIAPRSDSSDSDEDSEGPVTPETLAEPDVGVAVPELSLEDGAGVEVVERDVARWTLKVKKRMPEVKKRIPEVKRNAVRKVWFL